MKPKTTLNLLKYFFLNCIQIAKLQLLPFFEKNTWSDTVEIPHIFSIVFNFAINFAKTVLIITSGRAVKSENIKSAPPEKKYYYALQIFKS